MNDPDSTDPIVQIDRFQVVKGYIPNDWTMQQEGFYRSQRRISK
jgi:hypothetical protein